MMDVIICTKAYIVMEISITIHCQRHFAESDATVNACYAIMTTMEQMQELCCVPYIKWNWRSIRIVTQGQPLAQTVIFLKRENNKSCSVLLTVQFATDECDSKVRYCWLQRLEMNFNCYSNFNRRINVWTHTGDIQCFVGEGPYLS